MPTFGRYPSRSIMEIPWTVPSQRFFHNSDSSKSFFSARSAHRRSCFIGDVKPLRVAAIHLAQPAHELAEFEPVACRQLGCPRFEFFPARIFGRVAKCERDDV